MIPADWPFCMLGRHVRNIVISMPGTVTDIVSDRGVQRVVVTYDGFRGLIPYRTADFEDRFTEIDEPRRGAEIVSLQAYRRTTRVFVDFPQGAA